MAQRAGTTVAECFMTNCVRFRIGFHIMPGQLHCQLTPTFVGSRVYACLGETCHLHFWQTDQGLLCATAGTRGRNGHRIRVSTQELINSGEERSSAAPAGIRTRNLSSTSPVLSQTNTNKLSRLPTSPPPLFLKLFFIYLFSMAGRLVRMKMSHGRNLLPGRFLAGLQN